MFYELLKEVCKKKHTTPSAVCVALGMSKSNVTAWKEGRIPSLYTVMRIAKHLNVPLNIIAVNELFYDCGRDRIYST